MNTILYHSILHQHFGPWKYQLTENIKSITNWLKYYCCQTEWLLIMWDCMKLDTILQQRFIMIFHLQSQASIHSYQTQIFNNMSHYSNPNCFDFFNWYHKENLSLILYFFFCAKDMMQCYSYLFFIVEYYMMYYCEKGLTVVLVSYITCENISNIKIELINLKQPNLLPGQY